jgi:hypothetical protein
MSFLGERGKVKENVSQQIQVRYIHNIIWVISRIIARFLNSHATIFLLIHFLIKTFVVH